MSMLHLHVPKLLYEMINESLPERVNLDLYGVCTVWAAICYSYTRESHNALSLTLILLSLVHRMPHCICT